jgi:peptidyl-prolyl cis-trans isomerase SurA
MFAFKKTLFLTLFFISIGAISPNSLAIPEPASQPEALDSVVAVVNKSVITQSELDKEVSRIQQHIQRTQKITPPKQELTRQVLDKIILEKIQLQFAQLTGIQIDDSMVTDALEDILTKNKMTKAELRKIIEQDGMTLSEYRDTLKKELTISRLQSRDVASTIPVSQQEVDYFLQSPVGQDMLGQEYLVGHIMVSIPESPSPEQIQLAEEKAKALSDRLKQGEDFVQLSVVASQSPKALTGGNLGWMKLGQLPTLFVEPVTKMAVNDFKGPIRSPSGFHLIKLLDKRSANLEAEKISQMHVQHILVKIDAMHSNDDVELQVQHLRDLAVQGQAFDTLAKTHSQDVASAQQGGDLGWVSNDALLPEFVQSVEKLPIGEISKPFKTSYGWHLAKVLERRDEISTQNLGALRARQYIHHRKFEERLEAWLRQMKEEAYVKIVSAELNTHGT